MPILSSFESFLFAVLGSKAELVNAASKKFRENRVAKGRGSLGDKEGGIVFSCPTKEVRNMA
jgi:hypothetical protein